jgi:hypothetical protein
MIKTIDVSCREWFDKINGNSYFSARISVNYGMKNQKLIKIPFQYGYGEQYLTETVKALLEAKLIQCDPMESLWRYCQENKIILRKIKQENCKKKEVRLFGI